MVLISQLPDGFATFYASLLRVETKNAIAGLMIRVANQVEQTGIEHGQA